jgi:formylaminopyrimidine deformylase / aminopyrimidine aminohydrolase
MIVRTNELIAEQPEQWRAATSHPFLDGVRDGSLPAAALDRWLAQDYLFVERLLTVQARLLARAPGADRLVLAQGLVGLAEELHWFEELAIERGLDLAAAPLPANAAYCVYLDQLDSRVYAAAITALWAVEQAYLDAWLGARPGAAPYRALVEHWTTPSFAGYVAGLTDAADRALAAEPAHTVAARDAFRAIAEHERAFWGMALAG